jgi:8-oxo-dGTP pyrophosphatase MutT (NUDIX family)
MSGIKIVSGPIFVEQRRVLLVKHGEDNFFKFCGGLVESLVDANLLATARREAREELSVDFELLNLEPFVKYIPFGDVDIRTDYLFVHFLAKRIGIVGAADKIREIVWTPLDELYKIHKAPNIESTLEHFGFKFQ